jgi:hypothetical protein
VEEGVVQISLVLGVELHPLREVKEVEVVVVEVEVQQLQVMHVCLC